MQLNTLVLPTQPRLDDRRKLVLSQNHLVTAFEGQTEREQIERLSGAADKVDAVRRDIHEVGQLMFRGGHFFRPLQLTANSGRFGRIVKLSGSLSLSCPGQARGGRIQIHTARQVRKGGAHFIEIQHYCSTKRKAGTPRSAGWRIFGFGLWLKFYADIRAVSFRCGPRGAQPAHKQCVAEGLEDQNGNNNLQVGR